MILDIDRVKAVLYDESISGYEIEKAVGIKRTTVHNYRTGKNQFKNITFDTLLKLAEFDKKKSAQVDF